MQPSRAPAFTLIELLVVVSIIVLLLSLLAPAMDRAIYQAELALCGANQKGISGGVQLYAFDNKRYYPSRPSLYGRSGFSRPHLISYGREQMYDYRLYVSQYIGAALLLDPLNGGLKPGDMEPTSVLAAQTTLYSNYQLWFDWSFRGFGRYTKIGGSFAWNDRAMENARSNVLTSCRDQPHPEDDIVYAGHPDDAGLLSLRIMMDTPVPQDAGHPVRGSEWYSSNIVAPMERGTCDFNYGLADGSVMRLDKVQSYDPRLYHGPDVVDMSEEGMWESGPDGKPGRWTQFPGMNGQTRN